MCQHSVIPEGTLRCELTDTQLQNCLRICGALSRESQSTGGHRFAAECMIELTMDAGTRRAY
jgi:hypothetical protein